MPRIELTRDEKAINSCELCGGLPDFYVVRQIAPSMFLCRHCVK